MKKILFVSDQNYLTAAIKGGVQICTDEYLALLNRTNYETIVYPIKGTKKYWNRLLIKLGLNTFHHYDYHQISSEIVEQIHQQGLNIIALNQVNLLPIAHEVKKRYPYVKTILLSHGNESGDFLNEASNSKGYKHWIKAFKLGRMLTIESACFSNEIDLILCLSEEEVYVNRWLGSDNNLFIPRTFNPQLLNWNPELGKVGFVGTLNHRPNFDGINQLSIELSRQKVNIQLELVGNGENEGHYLQQKFSFIRYLGPLSNDRLEGVAAQWCFFLNPVFRLSRGASTKLAIGINWGIPILSTFYGNRGYKWEKGAIPTFSSPSSMAEALKDNCFDIDKLLAIRKEILLVGETGPNIQLLADQFREILDSYN